MIIKLLSPNFPNKMKSTLLLIALLLIPVSIFVPQTQAQAVGCGLNKTNIGVRFPKNPDSNDNFSFTAGKFFCVNNSTINGTGSSATPSTYKKARYALKLLTNNSPAVAAPLFSPFAFNTTNTCTASQNSLGIKFALTPISNNPTKITVKFCRGLVSGGIGDDARMKESIKQTLYYYYFPVIPAGKITVRRTNNSVI